MSGITLRQMLIAINVGEFVKIESEFGDVYKEEAEALEVDVWLMILTEEQLNVKFDYMRTDEDGHIIIGIDSGMFREYFKEV